jgi:hypothetical protein
MNGIGLIMGCYNRNNLFRGSSVGTLFVYLLRIVHSLLAFQEKFGSLKPLSFASCLNMESECGSFGMEIQVVLVSQF